MTETVIAPSVTPATSPVHRGAPASAASWRAPWLVLLPALALYGAFIVETGFILGGERYFALGDDAMISMRYAEHAAEGHGLVWNVGEPPIEGYTNFGWMLVMALTHLAGLPRELASLPVMIIGALLLVGAAATAGRLAHRVFDDGVAANAATAGVAFFFPLVFWTLRGFEVGILTLVALLAAYATVTLLEQFRSGAAYSFALLTAVGVLIRLDFVTQAAVMAPFVLWSAVRDRRVGALAGAMTLCSAILVAYAWFKLAYFGDILPNTYYLKLTGVGLAERLKAGLWVFVDVAWEDVSLVLAAAAAGLLAFRRMRTPAAIMLLGLFAVQCVYSIYSGGDFNEYDVGGTNRFISQGLPFVLVLAAGAIAAFARSAGAIAAPRGLTASATGFVAAVSIVAAASGDEWFKWLVAGAPELSKEIERVQTGVLIRASSSKEAVVATFAAGQIPYFAERKALDLFGKSDPVVAKGPPIGPFRPGHNKFNLEYSIGQLRPDVAVVGTGIGGIDPRVYLAAHGYSNVWRGIWLRDDSSHVRRAALEQAVTALRRTSERMR